MRRRRLAALGSDEQLAAAVRPVEHGEEHGPLVAARDLEQRVGERSLEGLEQHVDLAAARQADAERLVLGDAVGEERGSPVASTSCACTATSFSTQPPETEPHIAPVSETASFEPTGRGADLRVATTVAIAMRSPRSRHRST